MKYFVSELWYSLREKKYSSEGVEEIIKPLKEDGVVVLKNFLDEEKCNELKKDFLKATKQKKVWVDEVGSDKRIYGIDRMYNSYKNLFNNERLEQTYKKYISNKMNGFVMCNKVKFVDGNLGSGGGWHRDSINRRQLKFIVYLNDVKQDNGCFQYIKKSHTVWNKYKLNKILRKPLGAYRYTDSDVASLIKVGFRVTSLEGEAGDLLIVDTSGLHRGHPVLEGERFAATQYMFDGRIPPSVNSLLFEKV